MKPFNRVAIAVLLTLATVLVLNTQPSSAADWPQWRGPAGQGISTEKNLPTTWTASRNIKWKTPIAGRGHSSPIVWGKKIFLTTALEGEKVPGRTPGVTHKMSDGSDFVHPDAVGADLKHTFKVICLDRETGKILWERVAYEGPVHDSR
ncbi:MAG: PQQ-binding-like beta-propeller repeat protein, partial [Acidobacteriota bacterium]|nr:PQQ-binding-like beta-propeller repeat protein [Acidobacteriota bacterium]